MISELWEALCKEHRFGCRTSKDFLRPTTRLNFLVAVYEKMKELLTLTLKIEEAFPNEVEVISDLNELVFLMDELSRDLEDTAQRKPASLCRVCSCCCKICSLGLPTKPFLATVERRSFRDDGADNFPSPRQFYQSPLKVRKWQELFFS